MAKETLGKRSDQKLALVRNQVTNLLWLGKIETTLTRAKSIRSSAEKIITLAINSFEDTVKTQKQLTDKKGVKTDSEVINDGAKKLNARRKIMAFVYDVQEQRKEKESLTSFNERTKDINHPLIEKIFNEYAPKYKKRAEETGTKGGYTRILKIGNRRGDAAEKVIIEMI